MIQKVQIEPNRKGWARLADMYHKYDEDKIRNGKEDINTLLVFVRISLLLLYPLFDVPLLRLVYSQ